MSAITPDSYIKIVRFDVTKENQITFPDGVAQVNYFRNDLEGIELNASSYQRQNYKVRLPAGIDEIEKYNYMIVQNKPYNYKYYFYYITDMTYINDNMTEATIKLDVFQTYQFDFNYKECFVEREHVNNDAVGQHTVPEGIETGEYIIDSVEKFTEIESTIYLVQCTKDLNGVSRYGINVGGVYMDGCIWACGRYVDVVYTIQAYESDSSLGKECIKNIYAVPYAFTSLHNDNVPEGFQGTFLLSSSDYPEVIFKQVNKPSSIDGYVPKNKKLLTSPYCYLIASNEAGGNIDLKYENFTTPFCQFVLYAIATVGGSSKLAPTNYGNAGVGLFNYFPYALSNGKFPLSDVTFDNYKFWLNSNMFNIATAYAGSYLQGAVGIGQFIGGDYLGATNNIISPIQRIASITQEKYEKSKIPPSTVGQTSNGDINFAINNMKFSFYRMSIKREYARIIDDFFSRFGYKISRTKLPNIYGRQFFNYVKTVDSIVEGSEVPEKYLNEYREMLNNGITFWHSTDNFLNYNVNNIIV